MLTPAAVHSGVCVTELPAALKIRGVDQVDNTQGVINQATSEKSSLNVDIVFADGIQACQIPKVT